jgi:chemotaxis methyl-accepting protein methylase
MNIDQLATEQSLVTVVKLVEQATGIVIPRRRWPMLRSTLERLAIPATSRSTIEQVITTDAGTRRELISLLSIPETYMFRHHGHFDLLHQIAERLLHKGRPCRVLCAGCSTGEEVWSAAAVLADAGTPKHGQHQVIGWEISPNRIAHAWDGSYSPWSCRRGLHGYEEHFQCEGNQIVVDPRLREIVHFEQVNLVTDVLPGHLPQFDVIFFRNVAMYWRQDTVNRVCARLAGMVANDGAIFVGPSDPVELRGPHWQQQISNGVRTFWKQAANGAAATFTPPRTDLDTRLWHSWLEHPHHLTTVQQEHHLRTLPVRRRLPAGTLPGPQPAQDYSQIITRVQSLADRGSYDAALALLQENEVGRSLAGRLWRGILMLSLDSGQEAVKAFRQCVFLAPEEVEYRRWLAAAYEAAGMSREAARELRNIGRQR